MSIWFSRWWKRRARPARPVKRPRTRLQVESLEERAVLSTYYVVPGAFDNTTTFDTLAHCLNQANIQAGDVIQIEPGSNPGHIVDGDIPNFKNLTIQGDPAADQTSIPYFYLDDHVSIGTSRQGFTFKHVQFDVTNGTLQFLADATITDCHVKDDFAGEAIEVDGPANAVITDSYFESDNSSSKQNNLLRVFPGVNSHIRITDNQFVALTGTDITLLNYTGNTGDTDVIAHNTFLDNTGSYALLSVQSVGAQSLTIQSNTFTDSSPVGGVAIEVVPPIQNLQIVDNVISIPTNANSGILVDPGLGGASTSMVIANNHIHAGTGGAIVFRAESPGVTLSAKVEGNDLRDNYDGILMQTGAGGSVAGIDIGGGSLGSKGANDFRGDTWAITAFPLAAEGPVQAQNNIFSVANPTTVIYDHNNNSQLASVVATNPLTGNAAYVETLYLDFLHRAGDLNPSDHDAAIWVNLLNTGTPAAAVASGIARSGEGAGVAVDGLYHRFLGRDADPAGRAGFVSYLEAGGTLEGVSQAMLASPEYQSHFQTAGDFVQSLYQNLLHRTASTAEVNAWVGAMAQVGRTGVAQALLSSQEFRNWEVGDDYAQLLLRTPSAAEVNGWASTGLDILTIDALFASSPEFQVNG
jgi:hypothetical protein